MAIAVTGIVAACTDTPSSIGADFFNTSQLDVSFIDTMTVRMSTLAYDSMVTSDVGRILVGSYKDDKLGTSTATTYMQFGTQRPISIDRFTTEYDYMALTLYYDKYYYYDTLQAQTIHIHQITKEMKYLPNSFVLYNNSKTQVSATPLGSATFKPRPHSRDSIEIRLDGPLGKEIFRLAQLSATEVSSNNDFVKFLYGLAIVPDANTNAGFVGFKLAGSQLRVYYTDKAVVPVVRRHITFSNSSDYGNIHYCQYTHDRSATKLSSLKKSSQTVDSKISDNEAYVQAGGGLAMRIDIPYLRKLKENPNFYFTSAVLYIYPKQGTYDKLKPAPDTLSVTRVDFRNSYVTTLNNSAILVKDVSLGRDTRYQMNATAFVSEQLSSGDESIATNGMVFITNPAIYRSRFTRLIAQGPGHQDFNSKLIIYYATIK